MARLFTSGWEIHVDAGGLALASSPDGGNSLVGSKPGASRDTTVKRSGVASLKADAAAGAAQINLGITGALDRGYWTRLYVLVTTLPTANAAFLQHGTSLQVLIDTSGRIFCNLANTTFSTAINDSSWHRVEFYSKPSATQASRIWELRLDGATVSTASGQATDSAAYTNIIVQSANSAVLNFDDLAVNDDQGASQNTWPGDGTVLLLAPTADSAVGTGWTLGTGTAISANTGSTAVKNLPPLGVADLTAGSDNKQIRNATSNANVNYDATMTTYTAAGVPAGATINAVTPWVATGAPVTTSAKAGTVGVVSNPAITNVALSSASTSGAFCAANTAGAFPIQWKWSPGTVTYAPTVTLGTAPVMRVTQTTASTRVAMVCGMFIYVDYTPAAAPPATKKPRVLSTSVPAMRAALR